MKLKNEPVMIITKEEYSIIKKALKFYDDYEDIIEFCYAGKDYFNQLSSIIENAIVVDDDYNA